MSTTWHAKVSHCSSPDEFSSMMKYCLDHLFNGTKMCRNPWHYQGSQFQHNSINLKCQCSIILAQESNLSTISTFGGGMNDEPLILKPHFTSHRC